MGTLAGNGLRSYTFCNFELLWDLFDRVNLYSPIQVVIYSIVEESVGKLKFQYVDLRENPDKQVCMILV